MSVSREQIIETLKGMSLLEVSELVKELETTFGVSAAAPVAVGAVGGAAAPAAVEEQTEFSVILTSAGANKINVIKELRVVVTGLGLKEAKDLVEGAPKAVKEGASKDEANKIKTALEKAGAKVELK